MLVEFSIITDLLVVTVLPCLSAVGSWEEVLSINTIKGYLTTNLAIFKILIHKLVYFLVHSHGNHILHYGVWNFEEVVVMWVRDSVCHLFSTDSQSQNADLKRVQALLLSSF
jgi:hypothetical protein